jgi:hypothetical protein
VSFNNSFDSGVCDWPILGTIIQLVIGDVEPIVEDGLVTNLRDPDGSGPQDAPIAAAIQSTLAGLSIAGSIGTALGITLDAEFNLISENTTGLTYRIDSLRIPASLLEAHTQEREALVMAERGVDSLPRQERAELKELVRRELRRRMLPSMKGVDVVWNNGIGLVALQLVQGAIEEISELFLRTLGKNLLPEDPYSAADVAGWGDRPGKLLANAEPADFTGAL